MTAWRREQGRDRFFRLAKAEGYRARSAYKLIELDERYRLLRPGAKVLDLGAAPGSWSQVAVEKVGPGGRVVAVDLKEIDPIDGVVTIVGNIGDDAVIAEMYAALGGQADVVISDVAPQVSGIGPADQARSLELGVLSLTVALELLRPGGVFAVKVFRGDGFDRFVPLVRQHFHRVRVSIPEATRKESSECYVIGQSLIANALADPVALFAAIATG